MMVQAVIPYSPASKTDEILSRYRPIAPRPEVPADTSDGAREEAAPKIRHSPYLRNIWAHLQARPTRTRKRSRTSIAPSASLKKYSTTAHNHKFAHTPFLGLCCPSPLGPPTKCLSLQGFVSPNYNGFEDNKPVTLPLLSSSSSSSSPPTEVSFSRACQVEGKPTIDLSLLSEGLEEKDLILQLKSPNSTTNPWITPHKIIAPKPIRPIGSRIKVGPIIPNPSSKSEPKQPEEIEAEVESEELPSVISDSSNKVRMVNSAYKKLVGQPECPWLNSLTSSIGKRISGVVMLYMAESKLPVSSNGFSSWVRIEWGTEEGKTKKESVNAYCDVERLYCERKDYLFRWRFHTKQHNANANE